MIKTIAVLLAALMAFAPPASAETYQQWERRTNLEMQACNLRNDLYATRLAIAKLDSDVPWWVFYWPDWLPYFGLVSDNARAALGGYEADRLTVAMMASHWFNAGTYESIRGDLAPSKDSIILNVTLERFWAYTGGCKNDYVTHCSEIGCAKIPLKQTGFVK